MTEDTTDATDQADEPFEKDSPDETADEPTTAEATAGADQSTGERVLSMLQWAAFAILILVALIATLRFYFAASNAIDTFVTREYRPVFQAVFNLVILLASALGLSLLVRRIA